MVSGTGKHRVLKLKEKMAVIDKMRTVCSGDGETAVYKIGWSDNKLAALFPDVPPMTIKTIRKQLFGNIPRGGWRDVSGSEGTSSVRMRLRRIEEFLSATNPDWNVLVDGEGEEAGSHLDEPPDVNVIRPFAMPAVTEDPEEDDQQ